MLLVALLLLLPVRCGCCFLRDAEPLACPA
jgi:hypothetical protein